MTDTETITDAPEITLTQGELHLTVSAFGASLRGLARHTPDGVVEEIITGYHGMANKAGGQGDVLIPFPGRVRGGTYTFAGRDYQMERNDHEAPGAIHGFVRKRLWETESQTPDSVTFALTLLPTDAPGYPFALEIMVTYRLEADGLTCEFTLTNMSDELAPVAAGFHPYFTVGSSQIDTDTLHLPFGSYLEFENLLPTGHVLPVAGTPLDFRTPRRIGPTVLNTCYCAPERGPDGLVRITLHAGEGERALEVWMDRAFDYVVLYSGDPLPPTHRRRSLAIEPMTCATDAFNRPEWGLISLDAGESACGSWGVLL